MSVVAVYVQRKQDGYTVAHWEQTWFAPSESKHWAWRIASYLDPRNVHEPATSKLEKLIEEQVSADYGLEHLSSAGAGISAWSSGGYYQLSGRRLAGSYPTHWSAPFELAVSEDLGLSGIDSETGSAIVTALRVCVLWERADDLQASLRAYDALHRAAELVRRYDRMFRTDITADDETEGRSAADDELSTAELAQRCRLNLMLHYCMMGVDMADIEKWVQTAPLCREYDSKAMNNWRNLWERKEQLREKALAAGVVAASDILEKEANVAKSEDIDKKEPKDQGRRDEKGLKKKHTKGKRRKERKRDALSKLAQEATPATEPDPLRSLIFTRVPFASPAFMRRTRRALVETLFGASDSNEDDWLEDFSFAKELDVPAVEATIEDWLAMLDAKLAEEQASAEAASATKRVNLWFVDDDFLDQNPELAAELFERAPYFDGQRLLQRVYDEELCERAYSYFKAVFYLLERGHFKDALAVLQDNIMAGMVRQVTRSRERSSEMKTERSEAPPNSDANATSTTAERKAMLLASATRSELDDLQIAETGMRSMLVSEQAPAALIESTVSRPLVEEVDDELDGTRPTRDRASPGAIDRETIVEILADDGGHGSNAEIVDEHRVVDMESTSDLSRAMADTETMGTEPDGKHFEEGLGDNQAAPVEKVSLVPADVQAQAERDASISASQSLERRTTVPASKEVGERPTESGQGADSETPHHTSVGMRTPSIIQEAANATLPPVLGTSEDVGAIDRLASVLDHAAWTPSVESTEHHRKDADDAEDTSMESSVEPLSIQYNAVMESETNATMTQRSRLGSEPDESVLLADSELTTTIATLSDAPVRPSNDAWTTIDRSARPENISRNQIVPRGVLDTTVSTARTAATQPDSYPDEQHEERDTKRSPTSAATEDGPDPSPEHKRLYLLGCWYKLALHILDRITSLDRTAATNRPNTAQRPGSFLPPEDERAQAHLSNLLAYLPLLPRHRQAAVNVSIEKNMQLGNYGYATGWIDWAYDRFSVGDMEATRTRYDRMLDECEDAAWQNEYVVPELDRLMEYYGRGALKLREYLLLAQEEISSLWNLPAAARPDEDDHSSESTVETEDETSHSSVEDSEGMVLDASTDSE